MNYKTEQTKDERSLKHPTALAPSELLDALRQQEDEPRGFTEVIAKTRTMQLRLGLGDDAPLWRVGRKEFREAIAFLVKHQWVFPPETVGNERVYRLNPIVRSWTEYFKDEPLGPCVSLHPETGEILRNPDADAAPDDIPF